MDNETLFGLDVDILVLAALEGQITAANAANVRARILAEGANGPTPRPPVRTGSVGRGTGATLASWAGTVVQIAH